MTFLSNIVTSNLFKIKDQTPRIISIAIATALTLYGTYSIATRNSRRTIPAGLKEFPLVPGGLPFFGHLFQVPELAALKFDEWHKQYGPVFRINMGGKSWVIIADPDVAHDILKTKGAVTAGRPYNLFMFKYYALGEKGLGFTNPDKRWKRKRAIAQAILAPKGVASKSQVMQEEAARIAELLISETVRNGKINVVKAMQLGGLNIIMQTCFGKCVGSLEDPLADDIIECITTSNKLSAPEADIQTFLPILGTILRTFTYNDNMNYNEEYMRKFIYEKRNPLYQRLIQEALESDKECFLKEIYKVKDENELDDDDMIVFMVDLVTAGGDTIAISLAWSFLILSHHPDLQKQLHDEIDSFITKKGRLPTYDEREAFPLLISVQKECIRFRPISHLGVPHECTKDFEYRGHFIPEKTTIIYNTYSLNLNEDKFSNPKEFNPKRYLEDSRSLNASVNGNAENRDQFVFGWGRRICPGVHMSDVEMFYFWTRILATATIESPLDNQGQPLYPNLNAYHDVGVAVEPYDHHLRFVKRTDERYRENSTARSCWPNSSTLC
ncbi:cytochrome P450 [Zychaea mexicana]|uniref:cytochrome P450 n=1 Tax=Zychaea mexicana TaxID=64656 RepID=UPI0022FE381D|nr:cytochrome P450 [Zychaea mexicana]KAI9493952.1 cytochrome P450 [Zychaea mexicana]